MMNPEPTWRNPQHRDGEDAACDPPG